MVSPAPISGHPHTSVVRCAVGSVAEVRSHRSVSFVMKHTLLATHLRVGGGWGGGTGFRGGYLPIRAIQYAVDRFYPCNIM